MLLRGSSTRGARSQSSNRSRGSRGGRGSSRGASSSSKFRNDPPITPTTPTGPRALRDLSNEQYEYGRDSTRGRYKHPHSFKERAYSKRFVGTPTANTPNPFEQERLENSARREQRGRGQNDPAVNGRGNQYPRGNNQVRFNNPTRVEKKESASSSSSSNPTMNSFASNSPAFGAPSAPTFNPFAATGGSSKSTDKTTTSTFGAPASTTFNPFARPFPQASNSTQGSSPFGAPSAPASNPFSNGTRKQAVGDTFGSQSQSTTSSFGAPSTAVGSTPLSGFKQSPKDFTAAPTQATSSFTNPPSRLSSSVPDFGTSGSLLPLLPPSYSKEGTVPSSSSVLAAKIDELLRREGIVAPTWPTPTPGDPKQKAAIEAFWQTSKKYRHRVRITLIKAGLLDDPEKPKKLSEAIDFKGICEDMCPEFEKITRIMEHDVREPEKSPSPEGTLWPSPSKMIKALARSAAGQDAPLPMDVRSPAALRRTLDYLLQNVLGENEGRLPTVHGFLWDRTRAIRRDFVFQSSMSPAELSDQVYCLERITRFHVVALHQMSIEGIEAEDFSEQQEVEQLGKSLLSLIHAYEDCQAQSIHCENECEFRAYYILFNSHNTGIMETVQDWGWKFWGESEEIKIAVSLVETLQNTWDIHGPLKPHSTTEIASNAFSKFFLIVADKKVSYPMACFAEIRFNEVRKSALKAIFATYRLQRAPTKDWTLSRLNDYLYFDDEMDIVPFAEAYGLHFGDDGAEEYLSFEADDTISDPFPPLRQRHSDCLVEQKRGNYSLPEVIDRAVYDETELGVPEVENGENTDEEEGLFVKDDKHNSEVEASHIPSQEADVNTEKEELVTLKQAPAAQPTLLSKSNSTPTSILKQVKTQQTFPTDFFSKPAIGISAPLQNEMPPSTSMLNTVVSQSILGHAPTPSSVEQSKLPTFSFVPPKQHSPDVKSSTPSGSPGINTVVQSGSPKPTFNFSSSTFITPSRSENPAPSFPLGTHAVSSPRSEAATPRELLGNHLVETPTLTTNQATEQQEKTPQLQTSEPSSFIGSTRDVGSKKADEIPPQIYAKSLPQMLFQGGSTSEHLNSSTLPASSLGKNTRLDGFSRWVAIGDGGLVDQYVEFTVENLLKEAVKIYIKDETQKATRRAEDAARKEADEFRVQSLAKKYCKRWRSLAHILWLKRKGRNAREARKQYAENLRASKMAESANIVEDFKASTRKVRRNSLESLLDATGVLNGVHDSGEEIRAIVKSSPKSTRKRQIQRQSTVNLASKTTGTHKRSKTENPMRRSLLSDPSYLTGGSRIHLLPNYTAKDEDRKQVSGVRTDYFRLKARGITTMPDGTPLASSVARDILHKKTSFDGIKKTSTPAPSRMQDNSMSAPISMGLHRGGVRTTVEREEDIQVLKLRAKELVSESKMAGRSKSKRSFTGDDEELFERAKRVREQLDEGAGWYRKQIEKDTASRSIS